MIWVGRRGPSGRRQPRSGSEIRRLASRSRRRPSSIEVHPTDALDRIDDLLNGNAAAVAAIEGGHFAAGPQVIEGPQVGRTEVMHVNETAYTGAVG